MRACHYVVGYDFSFGWKGEGRPARLAAYCTEHGLGCDIISAVRIDGEVVSSTRIRALLTEGRIEEANRLLGHPHSLVDTVRSGFRLGHKLGSPTINMGFAPGVLVPRHGVYAAKVFLDDGTERMAVTNVGVRPTVSGGDHVSVESYILDYERRPLRPHRARRVPQVPARRAEIRRYRRAARADTARRGEHARVLRINRINNPGAYLIGYAPGLSIAPACPKARGSPRRRSSASPWLSALPRWRKQRTSYGASIEAELGHVGGQ